MLSLSRPLRPIDYSSASLVSKTPLVAAIRESRDGVQKLKNSFSPRDVEIFALKVRPIATIPIIIICILLIGLHMHFINWMLDDYWMINSTANSRIF